MSPADLAMDETEPAVPERRDSARPSIRLRNVAPDDLPILFEFQLDEEANECAATHPRSKADFDAHWETILSDENVIVRTILAGEVVAGCISCFEAEGQSCVGYWIGTPFWRNGIASQALQLLLREVAQRPLSAFVAAHNAASIRVLEKCGFVPTGRRHSPASDRYRECEEVIFERIH